MMQIISFGVSKHAAVHDDQRFVQNHLCKLALCHHVVFRDKRFSPGNLCKQAILVQSSSNWTVVRFKFNMLTEPWGV